MSAELETDYLVIGAGAAGMAFTDALLAHSDATITIVDRRHAPGGHWQDAYPYVRLHQPSTFYGVDSVPLGQDAIDAVGTNAGFYELAGAHELRAYYERVMHRHFLPTGRVRYFPSSDYVGEHRFVSRLTGATSQVRVRRKLVDTTYLEGSIPATSPPPFVVASGVRCVAAGDITRLDGQPDRFAIIGGGKTALDTCVWLLEQGVPATSIRWVRPRDAWWMNRKFEQPHTMLPELYRGVAIQIEAMAVAESVEDLFARLEAEGFFLRIDPSVTPTMFRGAVVSESELALLRQVEDVIRMGHVRAIERDRIVLDEGRIPTDERTVHIHCAARGLAHPPLRPIFEPGRVTIQPFFWSFACYQFAMLGVIEATIEGDDEKNRLCPPIHYWERNSDYASAYLATLVGDRIRFANPKLAAWNKTSRLNPASGVVAHRDDPRVVDARERLKRSGAAAAANLQRLVLQTSS
ncbi:MAG TPA: NAD(P)-binding protein [Kofleriaceae bacterium]